MTREDWAGLKPEEQRIKVAELCGWTGVNRRGSSLTGYQADGKAGFVPNYINDLNAMHEAENLLGQREGLWGLYLKTLRNTVSKADWSKQVHATAAQRAESFVITMEAL